MLLTLCTVRVIIPPSAIHRREFRHIQTTRKEAFSFLLTTVTAETVTAGPPPAEVHQSSAPACAFILCKTWCLHVLAVPVSAQNPPGLYLGELPSWTCTHGKVVILCSETNKQTEILEFVQILLAERRTCEISYFSWNLTAFQLGARLLWNSYGRSESVISCDHFVAATWHQRLRPVTVPGGI